MPAGWISPEGNIIYVGVDRPSETHSEVLRRLGFSNDEQALDSGWIRFVAMRNWIRAEGTLDALETKKSLLVEATEVGLSSIVTLDVRGPVVNTVVQVTTEDLLSHSIYSLVREARMIEARFKPGKPSVSVMQYTRGK